VTPVRIVQTSIGKFHHFNLARQFEARGMLAALFTGYPRWKLKAEGLPSEKIQTFPWLQTLYMTKCRFGVASRWLDWELAWWANRTLDAYAAARLPACETFIGLSGAGLRTGRAAQSCGAKYICDRGSSHIRFQDKILSDEMRHWGFRGQAVDPRMIATEEAEYAAADFITVPSEFSRRSFIAMGVPGEKLRKIPYGVERRLFRPVAEPERHAFDVLAVGQISFRKGIPHLLEAFRKLKHPRKRLRLVGPVQPEMRSWLRGRNLERVEFVGRKPQPELAEIMSRAQVFVLPSIEEGFGLVLAEAMSCGCPVIATENSGGPDMVTDGVEGFIVPIRNPGAIAARLECLAQDGPLRARMSQACLERAIRHGGWNKYGESFAVLCHELTGQSN